ncbi:hypothetical protein H5410_003326 [Solanum commersonii]|uniref:Uncharacterized protein n=1 Tax=Solanum commersonii TaxID=4109 RepID=A0A9J6B4I3_SOLCO|nr:hypothetical protein H5410_003326 [Solanum commersonii]
MPDPLGAIVDVSVGNVWVTGYITVSIRSDRSQNMPSSLLSSTCTDINSSSVSASDSACVVPSACTSPVVVGGIPEVLAVPHYLHPASDDKEAPGACNEEEEGAGILEGSEVRVDKDVSIGNESTLTSGEVSTEAALLLSTSSRVNSASIRHMSVKDEGITTITFAGSRGTTVCQHNLVIKTRNAREVSLFLALMAISCEVSSPRSICLLAMIEPRQATLGWRIIESLWDGIILLLMKPNQNLEALFMSLFSMGAPASIHLRVVSEIIGAKQPFNLSRD